MKRSFLVSGSNDSCTTLSSESACVTYTAALSPNCCHNFIGIPTACGDVDIAFRSDRVWARSSIIRWFYPHNLGALICFNLNLLNPCYECGINPFHQEFISSFMNYSWFIHDLSLFIILKYHRTKSYFHNSCNLMVFKLFSPIHIRSMYIGILRKFPSA